MSDDLRAHDNSNAIYVNLLAAYLALVQMRDYVRFLAKMTEPRKEENPELMLRPEELVWCFSSLGADLNDVAGSVHWAVNAFAPDLSRGEVEAGICSGYLMTEDKFQDE